MRILGKKEQEIYFLLEKLGLKIFSIEDLIKQGYTKKRLHKLLSSMCKKKFISRIRRGIYIRTEPKFIYDVLQQFESPLLIASKITKKYCLGYISAMQIYGVAEQIPFIVYIIVQERKRNFKYGKYLFKFVKVDPKRSFGFKKIKFGKDYVITTDKEKTIIDCLDHPEYCGLFNLTQDEYGTYIMDFPSSFSS